MTMSSSDSCSDSNLDAEEELAIRIALKSSKVDGAGFRSTVWPLPRRDNEDADNEPFRPARSSVRDG